MRIPNPESRWRRTRPLPGIDRSFLAAHLASSPELVERQWETLTGGVRTLNLRSGGLVARIALEADHSLAKEAALLRLMYGRLCVPQLIAAFERALILEYVEHEDLPASEIAGERTGSTLARIHSHRFERPGMLDERLAVAEPFPNALSGLLDWARGRLADPVAAGRLGSRQDTIGGLWRENEALLAKATGECVLVHGDFKPANVKWRSETSDVVVFDWDFAWAGPALCDLGQILRWDPPQCFVTGLERGYRSGGGRLPAEWRRLTEILDLANLVTFLADPDAGDERIRDVIGRVERTLVTGR